MHPISEKVGTQAMLSQCIICNSKYKESVDDLLQKGMPYSFITGFLHDKGIALSEQSVSRHNNKHRLRNEKPKQIQKKGIMKAQAKAKGYTAPTFEGEKFQRKGHLFVKLKDLPPVCPETGFESNTLKEERQMSYAKELAKMSQDIDVIKEYMEVLAIAKDRVKRGLHEETDSGLVLATTGNAIKDYAAALKNFHEITSGMESITKLRFAQLVQIVGNIFTQTTITDQTRAELLGLLEKATLNAPPIRVEPTEVKDNDVSTQEIEEEILTTLGDGSPEDTKSKDVDDEP